MNQCCFCPYCTFDEDAFDTHMLTHRNDPRPKAANCPQCGQDFSSQSVFPGGLCPACYGMEHAP